MIKTVAQRTSALLVVAAVVYIPANPLVRLEAVLGLSPAPLERYLGIKNVFSGMTEGMHQLIHGELGKALNANILTPFVVCALLVWAVTGIHVTTRQQEVWAGLLFIGLSALVNIVHPSP